MAVADMTMNGAGRPATAAPRTAAAGHGDPHSDAAAS